RAIGLAAGERDLAFGTDGGVEPESGSGYYLTHVDALGAAFERLNPKPRTGAVVGANQHGAAAGHPDHTLHVAIQCARDARGIAAIRGPDIDLVYIPALAIA